MKPTQTIIMTGTTIAGIGTPSDRSFFIATTVEFSCPSIILVLVIELVVNTGVDKLIVIGVSEVVDIVEDVDLTEVVTFFTGVVEDAFVVSVASKLM